MDTDIASLDQLAKVLTGSLARPDDEDYPSLRKSFLSRVEEVLPQAVVRCADPADVGRAVTFAREAQLPFAVRSGGHSFADFCCSTGLLIDLGQLDRVALDGDTVTVGPGVRLGPLARQLAEHDRILPCGWNPQVAVGGAVLGGGYGALSRHYGLGCDHLLAAQVVLADGEPVWVDEQREPELFWALRGAGWGSFGVVTALVLRTFPAPRMTAFTHRFPWQRAEAVIEAWQRWAPYAPSEVNAELVLQSMDPKEDPRVTLFGTVLGDAAQARPLVEKLVQRVEPGEELAELTELSPRAAPCRHVYAGMPVAERAQPGPPMNIRPWLRAVKSEFFDQPLPAGAITALLETLGADRPGRQYREVELIPWGGAFQQVPPEATAFVHRTPLFQIGHHGIVMNLADDEQRAAALDWATRSWHAVHPSGSGRVYPNYPDPDLPHWAEAYYGENLPRLMQVKARYDPEDVFQFAQSVPPPPDPLSG